MPGRRSTRRGAGRDPEGANAAAGRPGRSDSQTRLADVAAPIALSPASTPRPSGRCAWQVLEGEAVILDLEGRKVMGLNPVGSFVWGFLDGQHTPEQIATAVADRFQIAAERAAADVGAFLAGLSARGLIQF